MTYTQQSYPQIADHQLKNSRLYSDRVSMLKNLPIRNGGVAVEIGVALGDFSRVIIDTVKPSQFFAIDFFGMHHEESHWGTPSTVLFNNMTHDEFYQDRFKNDPITMLKGISHEVIPQISDDTINFAYIDAGHSYEDVLKDANAILPKMRTNGIIIFNDYTLFDQYLQTPYGVIMAANEFIAQNNFEVLGFAFEKNMFCDLAIRKI